MVVKAFSLKEHEVIDMAPEVGHWIACVAAARMKAYATATTVSFAFSTCEK